MIRSTPARAAALKTLAMASRLGRSARPSRRSSLGLAARWTTVSTPWKWVIQSSSKLAQVGLDRRRGRPRRPRRRAGSGRRRLPRRAELAADVAAGAGDQDGPRLAVDLELRAASSILGSTSSSSSSSSSNSSSSSLSTIGRSLSPGRVVRVGRLPLALTFSFVGPVGTHGGKSFRLEVRSVKRDRFAQPGARNLSLTCFRERGRLLSPDPRHGRYFGPSWLRCRKTLATASRKKKSPHMTDSSTPSFLWKW